VIGDAVNVAARVEECTRETGDPILVTEQTKAALRDDGVVPLEERKDVQLKGKREPVALYAPRPRAWRAAQARPDGGRAAAWPTGRRAATGRRSAPKQGGRLLEWRPHGRADCPRCALPRR
jgi:hypothetical protein